MNSINIIGIDPGNSLGVAVFNLNSDNLNINSIITNTYILEQQVLNRSKDDISRIDKLTALYNIVTYLCDSYQPVAIAMESAFMNTRFATAVISLSQFVSTIELAINQYNSFIKVLKFPPKSIKKYMSTGDAKKEDMLASVSKIDEISKHLDFNLQTEHSIDATSIGYVLLNEIRSYPWLLYHIP